MRCVLCARRDRDTELEHGHCCDSCAARIDRDLASIVTNADLAAIGTIRSSTGAHATYESKPPTSLDGLDPYAVLVNTAAGHGDVRVALWDVLTSWERMIREDRRLAPWGQATAHHSGPEIVLQAKAARAAVHFLRAHLDWIVSEPTFPLEDFATEIRTCANTVRALTTNASADRVVACPTIYADGTTCGRRLTVRTWLALDDDPSIGEPVTCRDCGLTRDPLQLMAATGGENAWADAEALAAWFGISQRTVYRWAKRGSVRRERGLYSWSDTRAMVLDKAAGVSVEIG